MEDRHRYRAWDKEKKRMLTTESLQEEYSDYGISVGEWIPGWVLRYGALSGTLMQWTGLKDREGKLIYEGDILEKEGATIVIKCEEWIEFYAVCLDEDHPNWCEDWIRDFYRIESFTIIGNIYETESQPSKD